jgi:lipopolysaccharide export system protein LptC
MATAPGPVGRTRPRPAWAVPGGSHDRLVAVLRFLLPIGIILLVLLLGAAPLLKQQEISFVLAKDRVDVARERMRLTEAVYRGEDSKGQPFALRAESAVQTSSRDPIVQLNDLSARIRLRDGPASIVAPKGRYDMSSERVAVDGPVRIEAANGYALQTRNVLIDLNSRRLASHAAVDGRMPLGTFRANRLRANLEARTATLEGGARLHIVQSGSR